MHIQDCLEEILHLEDTDLAASLADASRLFSCKKRQLVAKPDACSDWIPFLVSGVIRGYLTDEKGRDITDCFLYRPGEAVLSLSILTASFPINFEAVTDCVLLSIPTQLLAEQVPAVRRAAAAVQFLPAGEAEAGTGAEAPSRHQLRHGAVPVVSPPLSRAGGRGQHQAHRILFMYVPSVSEPPARAAAPSAARSLPVKQSRLSEKSGLF